MSKKVKITKREMKQDRFTTFVFQAKDYVMENWLPFVIGVVVVVAVFAGLSYWKTSRVKNEQQSLDIMSRAMQELQSKNYQLAIVDFQTIVDTYGSSDQAKMAQFNLGNAYFGAKNFAESKKAFETFLNKYKSDKIFTTSAMAGIAASLVGSGDIAGAADEYRQAAEKYPDFDLAGKYYYKAMEYYIKSGNMESAKVMYAKIAKDYADTQYYMDSQRLAGENHMAL